MASNQRPVEPSPSHEPERAYRRKLLRLLATATFFNGYDGFVLPFVLSLILVGLGGTQAAAGTVQLIAQSGAVVAFFIAAQADRIGRRRLLLITISGYTVAVLATALSVNLAMLTAAQFVAQVFLGSEWAVAITIVVEEFPTNERSRGLSVLVAMLTLGAILVGVLGFIGLGNTALGWRAFYLVGIVPLVVVAVARRGLRETERFDAVRKSETGARLDRTGLFEPWKRPYRYNLLAVGLLNFFRYFAVAAAVFWWPYHAQQEVGMSFSLSGVYLAAAGVLGAAGFLVAGRLMERWGRRPTFLAYTAATAVFGAWLFQTRSVALMLPLLCLAIFFGLGSGCITSAFATEFFPTYVRSRAAAWCRNAFEIPGGMLGPFIVGVLGDHTRGPIGSVGAAMTAVLIATLAPVPLIAWLYIGETKGTDLEALDAALEWGAAL